METLVVAAHHRNQYYSGSGGKANNSMRFGSSPSSGLRHINCRSFEAGIGLLPSPVKSYGSPVSDRGFSTPKPKTAHYDEKSPYGGTGAKSKSGDVKLLKRSSKSSPIAINFKGADSGKERLFRENMSFSELWAGPTYSNSPPPSSLPMPNFSFKPKRTVSLELPAFESDLKLQPMVDCKSAPASPTREGIRSSNGFFDDDDDNSATKTLRRILNLDIID